MRRRVLTAKSFCCSKAKCWAHCQKVASPQRCSHLEDRRCPGIALCGCCLSVYLTAPSCPHSWAAEAWEHCSRSCGSSGYQLRTVRCLQPLQDGTNRSVHSRYCLGERPESRRPCNRIPCPAQWKTGPWNEVRCLLACGV